MAECEECRLGAMRRRAHRRQPEAARPGGELSMDLSGPHVPGRWPSDSPEHYCKRAQYFLVASYRVFTDGEQNKSKADADFAKKKARRVHFEDEPADLEASDEDPANVSKDAGRGERK